MQGTQAIKHTNTILYQLLKLLPKSTFQKHLDAHKGDYRSRGIKYWDQLVIMIFSQLTTGLSLRNLIDNFNKKSAPLQFGNTKISTLNAI